VTPAEPGFARVRIAPQPGDLAWASGRVPTPHGTVEVDWRREGDRMVLAIEVPAGCAADVALPCGMAPMGVEVDDRSVDADVESGRATLAVAEGRHTVVLRDQAMGSLPPAAAGRHRA
jgi:hypothetical protein